MARQLELLAHIATMTSKLDQRARRHRLMDRYFEDDCPMPPAITESKLTKAYRRLMPVSSAPWGALVVESVLDRLEVAGIRDDDEKAAEAVWKGVWGANELDAEQLLAHTTGLISGRALVGIWPEGDDQQPRIWIDSPDQAIIRYTEGAGPRRERAALRRWKDEDSDRPMATLYLPDGIYKFQGDKKSSQVAGNIDWERRETPDEPWPVPNPYNLVPYTEIVFNKRLKSKEGSWGYARGEYEHVRGLIDRINLLTFLGLVVAFYMGFPLRGVIGEKILRDDDGNVLPPFDANADTVFTLENKDASIAEYKAADRDNLSIYAELAQLAAITKTPRHYFPLAQAMANLSADAIRADEGGLNAKVVKHKGSAGRGWKRVLRVGGLMLDDEVVLSPNADLVWKDHESRSLAERADAASKLVNILPWQALAERVLNANQDEINRWTALRGMEAIAKALEAPATAPAPASEPVAA